MTTGLLPADMMGLKDGGRGKGVTELEAVLSRTAKSESSWSQVERVRAAATADTKAQTSAGLQALSKLRRPGYRYKKAD